MDLQSGSEARRLRAAVESAPNGLIMVDREGRIVLANREIDRLFGYRRDALIGMKVEQLLPGRFRDKHPIFRQAFTQDPRARLMGAGRELFARRQDGSEFPVEIGLTPVETEDGLYVIGAIADITERRRAESERLQLLEELRQSQKMEAIGTLAGGVAHDFNNILGAIVGFAELAREGARGNKAVTTDLEELLRAAERGRRLVDSILRFSRRQKMEPKELNVALVVDETQRLLRAMLPAHIDIETRIEATLPPVMADTNSLSQVLMNLATNAAQAMPKGGTLSISVESLYVADSIARSHRDLHEGRYVVLAVRDTGVGMDETTRLRASEPFFTTKPAGEGTGLGLAVVHGIIRDHEGALDLTSAPGKGTTVKCFLPAREVAEGGLQQATLEDELTGPRILLVDDEASLIQVGQRRLESLGYRVIVATDPTRALFLLRQTPDAFDMLLTDHLMPRMTGLELAREARRVRPTIPIALMSGFIGELHDADIRAAGVSVVLRKPSTTQELSRGVSECLASAPGPDAAAPSSDTPP